MVIRSTKICFVSQPEKTEIRLWFSCDTNIIHMFLRALFNQSIALALMAAFCHRSFCIDPSILVKTLFINRFGALAHAKFRQIAKLFWLFPLFYLPKLFTCLIFETALLSQLPYKVPFEPPWLDLENIEIISRAFRISELNNSMKSSKVIKLEKGETKIPKESIVGKEWTKEFCIYSFQGLSGT